MNEEWKPIPNFYGYEVSSMGRIRSVDRIIQKKDFRGILVNYRFKGMVRRLHLDKSNGYLGQVLGHAERGQVMVRCHRAVWEAFRGPIPEGLQINHINGQKTDNRLENLELTTGVKNTLHAMKNKLFKRNQSKSLLADDEVRAIRFFCEIGKAKRYRRGDEVVSTIAKIFSRPSTQIYSIAARKSYGHVPD